jgi:hypothetical protein
LEHAVYRNKEDSDQWEVNDLGVSIDCFMTLSYILLGGNEKHHDKSQYIQSTSEKMYTRLQTISELSAFRYNGRVVTYNSVEETAMMPHFSLNMVGPMRLGNAVYNFIILSFSL